MKFRSLLYDAVRALPVYPRRVGGYAAIVLVVGYLAHTIQPVGFTNWLLAAGLLAVVAVTGWWLVREVLPSQTTGGVVARRGDREQRAGGVASIWDVGERASRTALRLQAYVLRPSTRGTRARRIDPAALGVLVARTGICRWPLRHWQELWSSVEDTTLRIGGPRVGKTIALACHGIDAPGALITTSTKLDLAEMVHQARREPPNGAVHVFNPVGFGDVPSTIRWSILAGCEDYATAIRRTADLLPQSMSAEAEHWFGKARTYLPVLLHAAAVAGRSVPDVMAWVRAIARDASAHLAELEIANALDLTPNADEKIALLNAFLSEPQNTKGSVISMITPALAWASDDAARHIGAAPLDAVTFEARQLIVGRETLHVIGQNQAGGPMAPLTSAFVAEIAHQARLLAATMPGGRLDPPVTMLLDEAAIAVRLPLDQWSADFGGRGITLHISVQSLPQLEQCWGRAGAGTLKGNTGTLILYGGGKDADELAAISSLCGERWRRVVTEDTKPLARMPGVQRGEWEKVPVLTAAQISNMPPG